MGVLDLLVLALPSGAPLGPQFLHHQKWGDDHPIPSPGWEGRRVFCPMAGGARDVPRPRTVDLVALPATGQALGARATLPGPAVPP